MPRNKQDTKQCDHHWSLLSDTYAYKCVHCLEVRHHPSDKDDCEHEYEPMMDGSYAHKCKKCHSVFMP